MNGTGPPLWLTARDYETIKRGKCISRGMYRGCVQTRPREYHWFEHVGDGPDWRRREGIPINHAEVTQQLWSLCQEGGPYVYNPDTGGFECDSVSYLWKPDRGMIVLVEVE